MYKKLERACVCSGYDSYIKNGFDTTGKQRWKCKYCGKSSLRSNIFKPICTDIAYRNPDTFTKEEMYCLGFIQADGCVTKGKMQLTLKADDICRLELIKKIFNVTTNICEYELKDGRQQAWMAFKMSYFIEDLYHLGLFPQKTGKEIWLPYMQNHQFIRGFFDGDGTIFTTGNGTIHRGGFTSASESFIENLNLYIATELEIKPKTINRSKKGKTGNYNIRYQGKQLLKFCHWLYQDSEGLRLERKYNKYLEIC